jgi:hypothetical protein
MRYSTGHQRLLDGFVQRLERGSASSCGHSAWCSLQRDVGILGGVFRGALDVDLAEGDLLRALAATSS